MSNLFNKKLKVVLDCVNVILSIINILLIFNIIEIIDDDD